MKKWLYDNWMRATPFLAIYTFILVFLYVRDANYALYLIWLQGIIYWIHEFEEYILPGGFLEFFNRNMMSSNQAEYPLSKVGSFWINIPLVYFAMPFSAVIAHFFGLEWGLWTAYFSFLNAFAHVVMFFKFGRKYNPGLIISILLNIPVAIYMIWYFLSNDLVSFNVNVISIIVAILAQASMMIYGFGFLKPKMEKDAICK
ncbi:HXXEE domain-containing protein [Helicobacter sp. MIT 05-5293]|uniref:HXXEE domain-containing protein n=1 Tax=Helicobacter sp. MIT 05-5293 TaxID=1548149 RepID=UPI00051D0C3B|nr:HXXEE domain-containing protein [Helicobacter sp. MIT 05-5293]TLD80264.1 HXXEE domain-containing protein [Helicobacter sp. MIT 05-5293]